MSVMIFVNWVIISVMVVSVMVYRCSETNLLNIDCIKYSGTYFN